MTNAPTTLYEIRSYANNDGKLHCWGSSYSREEAEETLRKRSTGDHAEWAEKYHRDWHVAEIDVAGMFVIPSSRLPRDWFAVTSSEKKNGPGRWSYRECQALDTGPEPDGQSKIIAEWTYRYAGRPPFEPFRQGDRSFALMAEAYTGTSVIDLQTGKVIAAEPQDSAGFCPVGFYVPDWWDVHDGSIKPGSRYWRPSMEQPDGSFGFVWGCVWGDDSSWKVQYLDLSRISDGEIKRDDRFGYVEIANLTDDPREFIHFDPETTSVTFATWQRFKISGLENRKHDSE